MFPEWVSEIGTIVIQGFLWTTAGWLMVWGIKY